jgi:serine/threonine-protein kinase
MHAELASDEDVRRFVGEARSVAQLSHCLWSRCTTRGRTAASCHLAMEHVPGRTLRTAEPAWFSPREALDVTAGVWAGWPRPTTPGSRTGTSSPESVLLNDSGTVKVADFGLARLLAGVSQTKTRMIIDRRLPGARAVAGGGRRAHRRTRPG